MCFDSCILILHILKLLREDKNTESAFNLISSINSKLKTFEYSSFDKFSEQMKV